MLQLDVERVFWWGFGAGAVAALVVVALVFAWVIWDEKRKVKP